MPAEAEEELYPPLSPDGEQAVVDASAFAAECASKIMRMGGSAWEFGSPLITRSEKWGVVWRVDFRITDADMHPLVNRVVCWKTLDDKFSVQVALGQQVPPLRVSS